LCRFEVLFREPPRTKRFGQALTANDPQANLLTKDWRKERDKAFENVVSFSKKLLTITIWQAKLNFGKS
jgi:hypothetical protein